MYVVFASAPVASMLTSTRAKVLFEYGLELVLGHHRGRAKARGTLRNAAG